MTWAAPGRRPTEETAPGTEWTAERVERVERAVEPLSGRRSPRPISVSGAGVKPVPPPRVSSRLRVSTGERTLLVGFGASVADRWALGSRGWDRFACLQLGTGGVTDLLSSLLAGKNELLCL